MSDSLRSGLWHVFERLRVPKGERSDLEQDVLLLGATLRDRYDPTRASVQTWLAGLARFVVCDFRKHHRRKRAWLVPEEDVQSLEPTAPGLNPEQAAHARRSLDALAQAMPDLVEPVFGLYAEGHTRAEMLERTGLTAGALAHRLDRLGEARAEVIAAMGEDPRKAPDVRFCVFPWWAFHATPKEDLTGALAGLAPPRRAWRHAAGLAAAAVLTAVTVPLGVAASFSAHAATALDSRSVAGSVPAAPSIVREPPSRGASPAVTAEDKRSPSTAVSASRVAVAASVPPGGLPRPAPAAPAAPNVKVAVGRRAGVAWPSTGGPKGAADSAVPDRLLRLAAQAVHSGAGDVAASSLAEHARRYGAADAADREQLTNAARLSRPR